MRVVVLTEGYSFTGYGHIYRCMAIAQTFKENNIKVSFIVNGDDSVSELLSSYHLYLYNWLEYTDRLMDNLNEDDLLFIDSYLAPIELYERVSEKVKLSVYLDDFNRLFYPCGVIVNGTVGAEFLPYKNNELHTYLLGKDYIILRDAFKNLVSERKISSVINTVLITFGGSDPLNLTKKVLKELVSCYPGWRKLVVLGPLFSDYECIESISDDNTAIYKNINAEGMRELMMESDLAFSAAGQTINELALTGLPSVIFKVAENQTNNISGWKKIGFIDEFIDATVEWSMDNLTNAISKLNDYSVRMNISIKGMSQIDVKGTRRIMKAALRAYYNSNLNVRLAKDIDMMPLFNLANDPVVRKNSFSTKQISLDEHKGWFSQSLVNDKRRLFVIYDSENLVGQVRFDIDGESAVISISITAAYRGFGLASMILEKTLGVFHDLDSHVSKVYAYVKNDNLPSRNSFVHAGFEDCENDEVNVLKFCYLYGK